MEKVRQKTCLRASHRQIGNFGIWQHTRKTEKTAFYEVVFPSFFPNKLKR